MPPENYEFQTGTPEQVEVFMDIQRLIVKLFNSWPGDTAIAVFGAALGSAIALIEGQYKQHLDECPVCRGEIDEAMVELHTTAINNLEYYYQLVVADREHIQDIAKDLVEGFFKGRTH
jgi:hypothetical protein